MGLGEAVNPLRRTIFLRRRLEAARRMFCQEDVLPGGCFARRMCCHEDVLPRGCFAAMRLLYLVLDVAAARLPLEAESAALGAALQAAAVHSGVPVGQYVQQHQPPISDKVWPTRASCLWNRLLILASQLHHSCITAATQLHSCNAGHSCNTAASQLQHSCTTIMMCKQDMWHSSSAATGCKLC
jgi:hypothetical protein